MTENTQKYQYLTVERKNRAGIIAINRLDKMNAICPDLRKEMTNALEEIEQDDSLIALVLTGAGDKAFIVGADIDAFDELDPITAAESASEGQALLNKIASFSKPTIAAVNGLALGGGFEICLACDLVVAVEDAKFALPEVRLGIIPGWGGTQRLSRLVGTKIAKEIIFLAEHISARRAYEIGVVNRVVSREKLIDSVFDLITSLEKAGSFALKQAKRAIDEGLELSLSSALGLEVKYVSSCFSTDEPKKRARAIRERSSKKSN
jgi:enoyl-CoA hydratase